MSDGQLGLVDVQRAVVFADCAGKARPRFDTRSRHSYTDYETARIESEIREQFIAQRHADMSGFRGPVKVSIAAYRALPEGRSDEGAQNIAKPDWDNIGKLVCDALNEIAWHDDSQIIDGRVMKMPMLSYGEKDRYEIAIFYMEMASD